MWKNYLKIAWRSIIRSKGFAFINVFGLAVGLAASVLIFVWILFERSIDSFYEKSDRIYAVWRNDHNQGEINSWDYTPALYAPTMKAQFPEVEEVARVTRWDSQLLAVEENSFYEWTTFTDPGFFTLFDFEVLEGDPVAALEEPGNIVLTKSVADKLFGSQSAMGETVKVEGQLDFKVSAIISDLPENTNFNFTAFLPFKKLETMGWADEFWGNNSYQTFALLTEGTGLEEFNQKFEDFTSRNSDAETVTDFLFPMADLHLKSKFENGKSVGGRIDLIRMFGIVAIIVLLIACINFMNLSTAQGGKRAKEVGVRKISGAGRGMLIRQFLTESALIALVAYLVALVIVSVTLPVFSDIIGSRLPNPFGELYFWVISLAYILVTGILAGSYPAFLLSSFQPAIVFQTKMNTMRYWFTPRQVLVVFQFMVVVMLISSAWIIRDQMDHVQNRDLGIDQENLIFHPVTSEIRKNKQALRNELLALPEVKSVSYTFSPLTEIYSNTQSMNWQGKDEGYRPNISRMATDADLIETAGMELIAGREIDTYTFPSDSSAALINQKTAEIMGFDDPIGQVIDDDTKKFTVVGVVKDFIMDSPFEDVKPIVIVGPMRNLDFIHIRLNPGNTVAALGEVEAIFKKFNSGFPFEYRFVDQEHERKFSGQKQTAQLTGIFTLLAISISCMGLFGLAAFMAEQRSKELSVRKVFGASVMGLIRLISSEFTKLVLVSVVLAIPITWYLMNNWLETFPYRISIDWQVFLWTAMAALGIAFVTVSSQAFKAARVNPTKLLRSE
ncbi:ABC transporter permease [Algoriphagus hitonicola]|uniref:ABC-type antimicrobial peptide transport system, permease component n=1 Tax=Algoriphagus hitonicola TaxID=435880 RepID=A0A1I2SZN5_9BACT|nr:ABC transporter permease [Algoriphagus hitonicola]SFG58265.1 ABC-type antimicrobial peptide transport system, permease component [Algoriphagus hitonicola]